MKRWIFHCLAGVAVSVASVHAHHSISGAYDTNRQVNLQGVVNEFHFVNPHPFVTLDVTDNGRNREQWRLEMDNRSELSDVGMTKESFRPGDRIIVTGHPRHLSKTKSLRPQTRSSSRWLPLRAGWIESKNQFQTAIGGRRVPGPRAALHALHPFEYQSGHGVVRRVGENTSDR